MYTSGSTPVVSNSFSFSINVSILFMSAINVSTSLSSIAILARSATLLMVCLSIIISEPVYCLSGQKYGLLTNLRHLYSNLQYIWVCVHKYYRIQGWYHAYCHHPTFSSTHSSG